MGFGRTGVDVMTPPDESAQRQAEDGNDRREGDGQDSRWVEDDGLWRLRPALRHIRQAAHARGVSAEAVLSVTLARVVAEVDPHVTLPPLIGSEMSLNKYVALVGPSGSGKTSVMAVVEDLYPWTLDQESVGSGEGLIRGYGRSSKEGWCQARRRQFLYVDEVASLKAQTSRSGSTLLGVINTAWTGQALSQQYADPAKHARIPRHGYRLSLVVGVQLRKADALLNHSDAGTPQRFTWVPMVDPTIPPPAQAPPWPGALQWEPPATKAAEGTTPMPVPEVIADGVRARFQQRAISWDHSAGDRDHDDLLQLKMAGALALLDGRLAISVEDWGIAAMLMGRSRRCLRIVGSERQKQTRDHAKWAGERQGHQAFAAQEMQDALRKQHAIGRTARRIANHVHRHAQEKPEGCTKKCAKNGLSQDGLQGYFDDAVDRAREIGWIRVHDVSGIRRLLPGEQPTGEG